MSTSNSNCKTVLITGCSPSGIGHELAREYHSKGLRVIATARNPAVLSDLTALGMEALELDVTKSESVKAVRDRVASLTGGTLDILVNNAGQGKRFTLALPATDFDIDEVKGVFEVNLFGVMRMVQEFAPLLIASGDGRIVNIGSIGGVMPFPFNSPYNASKAALNSYGNTLRLEMAPFNVQVVTIITGGVQSKIYDGRRRTIQPSSIYAPIADLVAKQRPEEGATPTTQYARTVVAHTLKRRLNAWFWTGHLSFACWFIDTFTGRRGFDWLFSRASGLATLKGILLKQKKQN